MLNQALICTAFCALFTWAGALLLGPWAGWVCTIGLWTVLSANTLKTKWGTAVCVVGALWLAGMYPPLQPTHCVLAYLLAYAWARTLCLNTLRSTPLRLQALALGLWLVTFITAHLYWGYTHGGTGGAHSNLNLLQLSVTFTLSALWSAAGIALYLRYLAGPQRLVKG